MTLQMNPVQHVVARTYPNADRPRREGGASRMSRWAWVLYVAMALVTPLVVYSGPDVMTPAASTIADAALDGHLSLHA
jgi:hypothetical protein